jgi:hypothetical protein
MEKVKRVDSLTEEQKARIPEWVEKWSAIGLSTEPANRKMFEENARICYEVSGLKDLQSIVWTINPMSAVVAGPIAALIIDDGYSTYNLTTLIDQLKCDSCVKQDVTQALAKIFEAVPSTGTKVLDLKTLKDAVQKNWSGYIGGQFWVGGWYWGSPAYVSYFTEVCNLDLGEDMQRRATAYENTTRSACWWWPHAKFIVVSDRPMAIHRDKRGRLHNTNGLAIQWRDGWGLARISGVAVPTELVTKADWLTPDKIEKEQNAEVRRVMMQMYGEGRFLSKTGATLIHEDKFGKLYRKDLPGDEPLMMVKVTNSSPEPDGSFKEYFLRVHPELRPRTGIKDGEPVYGEPQALTAHNAVASTFRRTGKQYKPIVET